MGFARRWVHHNFFPTLPLSLNTKPLLQKKKTALPIPKEHRLAIKTCRRPFSDLFPLSQTSRENYSTETCVATPVVFWRPERGFWAHLEQRNTSLRWNFFSTLFWLYLVASLQSVPPRLRLLEEQGILSSSISGANHQFGILCFDSHF